MSHIFVAMLLGFASQAMAQVPPFFTPAPTAFDPQISVVNSGAVLDAQAVVSNDRKYVTINARPSISQLIALRSFQVPGGGPLGFVGGVDPTNPGPPNALNRRGMFLLSKLQ